MHSGPAYITIMVLLALTMGMVTTVTMMKIDVVAAHAKGANPQPPVGPSISTCGGFRKWGYPKMDGL